MKHDITLPQRLLLASMEKGAWYGDRIAFDVSPWPKSFNPKTFRQIVRRLVSAGLLEKSMRRYGKKEHFIVRLKID